jgi:hypothetical protein
MVEKSPTGSRLPPDWKLTEEYRLFCLQERPELNPEDVANRFRDYWHGVAGANGRKADWLATWRNWVRSQSAPKNFSASITKPSRQGKDPAILAIEEHAKKAIPMPEHLRTK